MWALDMTFYLRSWGCESKMFARDVPLWMGQFGLVSLYEAYALAV